MLEVLAEATAYYLKQQADAGVDALMLFDSWAEGLPDDVFERIVIKPTKMVVDKVRSLGVTQPIIGFPRGSGVMLPRYAQETGVTAVGLDSATPLDWANEALPQGMPVQGNLDPLLLIAGGDMLTQRVRKIVHAFRDRPHIFNLGHGVTPETPIAHVEQVVKTVREMT